MKISNKSDFKKFIAKYHDPADYKQFAKIVGVTPFYADKLLNDNAVITCDFAHRVTSCYSKKMVKKDAVKKEAVKKTYSTKIQTSLQARPSDVLEFARKIEKNINAIIRSDELVAENKIIELKQVNPFLSGPSVATLLGVEEPFVRKFVRINVDTTKIKKELLTALVKDYPEWNQLDIAYCYGVERCTIAHSIKTLKIDYLSKTASNVVAENELSNLPKKQIQEIFLKFYTDNPFIKEKEILSKVKTTLYFIRSNKPSLQKIAQLKIEKLQSLIKQYPDANYYELSKKIDASVYWVSDMVRQHNLKYVKKYTGLVPEISEEVRASILSQIKKGNIPAGEIASNNNVSQALVYKIARDKGFSFSKK